jgi:hypothetical protein
MQAGLRRASAFLGYGVKTTEGKPLRSLTLASMVSYDPLPDPLPPDDAHYFQTEFRSWVVGQGLIELDQTYHRFLSTALDTYDQLAAIAAGTKDLITHRPRLENTANLHALFYKKRLPEDQSKLVTSGHLRSLVNARNCLAHDSGLVTPRRLTDGETMQIRWLASDVVMSRDGEEILVPREQPLVVAPEHVGAQLTAKQVVREQSYRIGDRVFLSAQDLAEIIFFYQLLAMGVAGSLHSYFKEVSATLSSQSRK